MKNYALNPASRDDEPRQHKINYTAALNEQQWQAVQQIEGPQLVIAGAGTGKTRTLVYRVAYLVEQGVDPGAILLLTFTRKASREMLRRAALLLDDRCQRIQGGTFHSFANTILRQYAAHLDYPNNFTIVDRGDAEDIVNMLRGELNLDKKQRRFPKKRTLVEILSKAVNTNRPVMEVLADDYPHFLDDEPQIMELAERFQRYKQAKGLMDYDDLLVNLRRLLTEHDAVRRKLSRQFRYILVDEYQDTNLLQAMIAALLASEHANLMVVGDDSQSIYAFRGAQFKNIMDFPKIFPNTRVTTLEQNYRSNQPILDFTNAIIASAREKYSKNLFSEITGEQKPVYLQALNEREQSRFICQRILELREEGIPLDEIAVLFRSGWHSTELEIELNSSNIPFVKYGGMKFTETAHVKDVTALLRIMFNPFDAIAWYRSLLLLEGVGPATAREVLDQVVEAQKGPEILAASEWSKRKIGGELTKLRLLIGESTANQFTPAEETKRVLDYYLPILKQNYDDYHKRTHDLEALTRIAERYQDLEAFLTDLTLEPPENSQINTTATDKDEKKLVLSTIHSAKGLEWHSVFLINLVDGFLPATQSLQREEDIEEERRLFYVATTRAKQQLYLLTPELERGGGLSYFDTRTVFTLPSRFIQDIENFADLTEQWTITLKQEEESEIMDDKSDAGTEDDGAPNFLKNINDYFNEHRN